MGITITNKNTSIDMGCFGFYRIRSKVAHLVNEELGKFYDEMWKDYHPVGDKFWNTYDTRLSTIDEELGISHYILDFLYASDCEAKMSVKHIRRIWNAIKDYEEDFKIGYVGLADCATFQDFKRIVRECYENRWVLTWY